MNRYTDLHRSMELFCKISALALLYCLTCVAQCILCREFPDYSEGIIPHMAESRIAPVETKEM